MDNMYQPGGVPGQPGFPGQPQPSFPKKRRRVPLAASIAAACLIVGGAAYGVVTLTSSSPAAANTANSTQAAAQGPTGQAAVLNSLLSSYGGPATNTPNSTTPTPGSTPASTPGTSTRPGRAYRIARMRARRWALGRLRALGGMYGQFTFDTKKGQRTLAFERGTIESVNSTTMVVRAKNGVSQTWEILSTTRVRDNGTKVSVSSLAVGQPVFVGGPVVSAARDSELIVIRPVTATSSS